MSKIVAISSSPRIKSKTELMIKEVIQNNPDCELISLRNLKIGNCLACGGCYNPPHKCIVNDDMQKLYDKLEKADILILGSPTYFDNVTGLMKNFMDRTLPFYLSRKLENKKTILITIGNYTGGEKQRGKNVTTDYYDKKSAKSCIQAMKQYSNHLRLQVTETVIAIKGDWTPQKNKLKKIGNKLK